MLRTLACSSAFALAAASVGEKAVAMPVPYNCMSQLFLDDMVKGSQKGLGVDDTTFANCSELMFETWPHSSTAYVPAEKVRSLRIFKPWAPEWPEEKRAFAWKNLVNYIHRNKMKVLLGTSIGCFEDYDRQAWEWTKELLQMIGKDHLMGLAIGNELEIFHRFREELNVDDACLERLWDGGYAWEWFQVVAAEFDAMGYEDIPITSVFGGLALAGKTSTFYDIPEARVNTFLSKVASTYQERFVFCFNFYPYFDPFLKLDSHTEDQCKGALAHSLCWDDPGCNLPATTAVARRKITNLTGNPNWRMWLGEVGWSSRYPRSLESVMKKCPEFSSPESFLTYYKGFLRWDLSISNASDPLTPPEHVFWFTMRDSYVFGILEYFGFVSNCDDLYCKTVQDVSALVVPEPPREDEPMQGRALSSAPGHLFAAATHLQVTGQSVTHQPFRPNSVEVLLYPLLVLMMVAIVLLVTSAIATFGLDFSWLARKCGKVKQQESTVTARKASADQTSQLPGGWEGGERQMSPVNLRARGGSPLTDC